MTRSCMGRDHYHAGQRDLGRAAFRLGIPQLEGAAAQLPLIQPDEHIGRARLREGRHREGKQQGRAEAARDGQRHHVLQS
jgi:hypothetical protein